MTTPLLQLGTPSVPSNGLTAATIKALPTDTRPAATSFESVLNARCAKQAGDEPAPLATPDVRSEATTARAGGATPSRPEESDSDEDRERRSPDLTWAAPLAVLPAAVPMATLPAALPLPPPPAADAKPDQVGAALSGPSPMATPGMTTFGTPLPLAPTFGQPTTASGQGAKFSAPSSMVSDASATPISVPAQPASTSTAMPPVTTTWTATQTATATPTASPTASQTATATPTPTPTASPTSPLPNSPSLPSSAPLSPSNPQRTTVARPTPAISTAFSRDKIADAPPGGAASTASTPSLASDARKSEVTTTTARATPPTNANPAILPLRPATTPTAPATSPSLGSAQPAPVADRTLTEVAQATAYGAAASDDTRIERPANGSSGATPPRVDARPATATHGAQAPVGSAPASHPERRTIAGGPSRETTADAAPNAGSSSTTQAQDPHMAVPLAQTPTAGDAGSAKTVTGDAKPLPTGGASPAADPAKLRDAIASVTNHAVLRGPATGQIEVPDFGRVAVRAHSAAGAVDVDVTADRADARAMLRGHVGAIAADLRVAEVPVARLTVDRASAPFGGAHGSPGSFSERGGSPHDSPRDAAPGFGSQDDDAPAPQNAPVSRVRIVL